MPHVELQILLQVARQPCHGYEMMKEIPRETRGAVRPGPGTLYVALRRLVDDGRIRRVGPEGGATAKRAYRITKRGQAALDGELERLAEILRQADGIGRRGAVRGRA